MESSKVVVSSCASYSENLKKRPGMRISRKNFENELQRELFPDFLRNNSFPEKLNFDCLFPLLMGAYMANILKNIYTPYLFMVFVKFI